MVEENEEIETPFVVLRALIILIFVGLAFLGMGFYNKSLLYFALGTFLLILGIAAQVYLSGKKSLDLN